MSSLPLISHRLFVAATGNEAKPSGKTARTENAFPPPVGVATAIPLELLKAAKSIRSDVMRRLAGSSDRDGS
jgi:hypothetical protein